MGSGAPLLNDYKKEFFWKRFPQTILGGPKLRIGYEAPAYVYINQVLLFLTPWIIGGIFTALIAYNILTELIGCIVYGVIISFTAILLHTICTVRLQKKSSVSPLEGANIRAMLAEDDEVDFDSCCGLETVEFIIPPKKYKVNIVLHGLVAGSACGVAMSYLLPSTLDSLFGNVGATVVLYGLGWITVCIAHYSSVCHTPPEWASLRTSDSYEINAMMRPFYVLLLGAFHLINR